MPISRDPDAATAFADRADAELLELATRAERANWVHATHITDDTAAIAAEANQALTAAMAALARGSTAFGGDALRPDVERRLALLRVALPAYAAPDPVAEHELADLEAWLEGAYATGRHAPRDRGPLDLGDLSHILATSRDPGELLDVWTGWHAVGRPMREPYMRFVELAGAGARSLGFADAGEQWRSAYDLPPEQFAGNLEATWQPARRLYASLHAYVRRRLHEAYGSDVVDPHGPIPAHLLGDMWAQDWTNVADLVAPPEGWGDAPDVTTLLEQHGFDARAMVRTGEAFFTSLGFEPLPATFWERSMFTRPADRDVVCHPSAWTIGEDLDLRLKMCIKVTGTDFVTIHHELGHLFYMRAYRQLPYLFRGGANDGFHEAIGDAVALSVTPAYLRQIGLLDDGVAPSADDGVGLLLRRALDLVPRLPWTLAVDRWRWAVFSGELPADEWNAGWWGLRRDLQGVVPPVVRTEGDFDPGAKYHVPANVPYARYYLATLLQFQFHQALTELAGLDGPLHLRSVFGHRGAGERLAAMLAMGRSRPWPEALEALTGERELRPTALLAYFAPLQAWLDRQNEGRPVGW